MLNFIRQHQAAVHSVLLIVLGMVAFWPSVSFDFVNWDDPIYVQNNLLIRDWSVENLKAVSTEVMAKNYAPLTTLSFMVDYSLWELNPCGYHATNVILHLVNGVLVYLLITQLSGSRFVGFFTAALFLVHPVQIESVAWISSRKGLLCSLFMLWACIVRLKPVAQPVAQPRDDARYFILLALALLCKAHAIVLPAIVLLYDLLVRRDKLSTAIPRQFISGLMSLALLLITMGAQNSMIGGVRTHMSLSLLQIVAVDVTILWKYLGMLLVPTNLCVMYDPPVSGIWKQVAAGSAGLVLISIIVWKARKTQPLWLLGCLSIFLLLFPMLNFFRITTLMNDRYLYLPCIILFAFAIATIRRLLSISDESLDGLLSYITATVRCSLAATAVVACLIMTARHLPVWTNSQSLWAHASEVSPKMPIVRIQSALTAHGSGQVREGIRQLKTALLETQPDELDRERMQGFIAEWTESLAVASPASRNRDQRVGAPDSSAGDAVPTELLSTDVPNSDVPNTDLPNSEATSTASPESHDAAELPQPFLSAVK